MPGLTASHGIMGGLLLGFAFLHSGLAALRPRGESLIGARLYRVFFALVSIPSATGLIIYFFNHRYDGAQLWQVQGIPGIRELVWIISAISFLFLYPATFNLLEIAAIQKPEVHLFETGIIRISRHPQMVGQGGSRPVCSLSHGSVTAGHARGIAPVNNGCSSPL
jgi:uncharacterized membrane protein